MEFLDFSATTVWIVIGLVLCASELLVGTFYLLVLGAGAFCTAFSAYQGANVDVQCMIFSLLVIIGGYLLGKAKDRWQEKKGRDAMALDVGQWVKIEVWDKDGTAKTKYRGAEWTVFAVDGTTKAPGNFEIVRVEGPCLVVKNI